MLSPLIDPISALESKSMNLSILFYCLFGWLYLLFMLELLSRFFILYETLIVLLFFILFPTLPSHYRIRTAFSLSISSLAGSVSFITSLVTLLLSDRLPNSLLILLPFHIKIPCLPLLHWLLEVHCEVNSSISLYSAGSLSKLGLSGCIRFILSSFFIPFSSLVFFVVPWSIYGVIIVPGSIFRYHDLKKIIAFPSILHSNLTPISIHSRTPIGSLSGIIISPSHASSPVPLSHYIGLLLNKTSTRYSDSVFFIPLFIRGLFLFLLSSNISSPVTHNPTGEVSAFISYWFIPCFPFHVIAFSTFLSFLYWFLSMNRKLPYHRYSNSLNFLEFLILSWFVGQIYTNGIFYLLSLEFHEYTRQ